KSSGASWQAYKQQGDFLKERSGSIDAHAMIGVLRGYPASHPCLHQAVMCPTDGRIWVSHATDPATDPLAGAHNQPFHRYDLNAFWKGGAAAAARIGERRTPTAKVEVGEVATERAIKGTFAHEPKKFHFRLRPVQKMGKVEIGALTFPSPGPSRVVENLTVHAEYYRPAGEGPFPSVVVLHILDGRFYAARLIANALAQRGIAALFIKLPYYGERRPQRKIDPKDVAMTDVVDGIHQAVRDIRRGAAWLRARGEIDHAKVGIVGVSLGSFVAQLAAGADGGFDRCMFVLGGGSIVETVYAGSKDTRKMERELERRGWNRQKLSALLGPVEPIRHVAGIRKETVMMINCNADEVVPPASTRRYWEAIGKPPIQWYDGGHYAIKNHVFEVLNRVVKHFMR
ncbi:MAG: alpha/beta hydrolase family protein, partial [Planctomycetota bacterium]|nr:alpha/beta hydrolase family protein [Planctomycetota bacterium]